MMRLMKSNKKNLVFLTGAGVSAESGIPTFRDENGLWRNHDCMELASIEGFIKDPQAVLDFYNERRKNLDTVEPNEAHRVIASLESRFNVTVVTQNVDDLHERAGSQRVLHLHGELRKVTSSIDKYNPKCIEEWPLDKPIKLGDKAADGSQVRPYIVWFGENLSNEYSLAVNAISQADILVVIGTSLTVSPACFLVNYATKAELKYIIDPHISSDYVPAGFELIKEIASDGMKTLTSGVS